MSISQDDIIQNNTGTFSGTTGTASLPSGTLDGSTVILFIMTYGTSAPLVSGFTRDHGSAGPSTSKSFIMRKSNVVAGEISWAITGFGSTQPCVWFAVEIINLHRAATFECNAVFLGTTAATSIPSNTTPASTIYEGLAFAFHGGQNTASSTIPTWSGQTGGFLELYENSIVVASTATSAAVSLNVINDIGAYQSTATASITVTGSAVIAVYAAAASHRQANLDIMCGFEVGTVAGLATGNATNPPVDSFTGTPAIISTSPRTGTYCLELSATSAIENVAWTSTGALSLYTPPSGFIVRQQYVLRVSFYFPSSLPGADVGVLALDQGTGTTGSGVQVVYRTATQKLGVQVSEAATGLGTEVFSANAMTVNTWYSLDIFLDMANEDRGSQWRAAWQIDGVDQTTATRTTSGASTVAAITQVRLGWLTSTTATIRYDDLAGSKHPGHYPLGVIGIYPLLVDPGGTVTATTAADFSTFTANGTLNSTFSGATALGAVDDIPPTIGASADGFCQDTISATDYVELPMQTRSAATNLQVLRGVRWYFCGWAASTTAATIGFRSFDGTNETLLFAAADPNFDNATTDPAWVCRMHRDLGVNTVYAWTQAKLDALTARVGFSTDVSPVIGVHAILAEVAMCTADIYQVLEQDGVFIYAYLGPATADVIAFNLVAPPLVDAWALYRVNGVDINRTATAGTNDLYIVGAESNSVVSFVTGGLS